MKTYLLILNGLMNLLKWALHAYQCTLWLPTENTLHLMTGAGAK
jgi:hypothetical protein